MSTKKRKSKNKNAKKLLKYLKEKKIHINVFASQLGISRCTFYFYLRTIHKIPVSVKIAIEFLTGGEIRRDEWK